MSSQERESNPQTDFVRKIVEFLRRHYPHPRQTPPDPAFQSLIEALRQEAGVQSSSLTQEKE